MAVTKLTTQEFDAAIAGGAVLVDFFATWCAPCRMLAPDVHALAEDNPSLRVYQVDVDEEPALAQRFRVMSIPTLMTFKDGQAVRTAIGRISREELDVLAAEVLA